VPFTPKKCVVVPIDFSDSSIGAIETALEFALNPASVHVIHVVLPTANFSPEGEWAPLPVDEVPYASEHKRLADYLEQHGFKNVTQVVRFGDPGTEVADYAREQNADLIVIPSHGYQGVKRLVFGSVAESVIRHVGCAVLVLHRADSD